MANHLSSLSIFFPCYNDKGTIATLVLEARQVAERLTDDFEIIVIDDGSSDGSRDLLLELQNQVPQLRLVFHERNMGYGGALCSGSKTASKDFIVYTDGDGQYDVKELPLLVEGMQENIDVVNGFKIKRSDPWHRVIIGYVYQQVMRLVFWLPIKDPDCDFRLIRRKVFGEINLKSSTGTITIELVKKIQRAGFKFAEVGVSHYFRVYGQSQFFNFSRVLKTLWKLIFLWFELMIFSRLLDFLGSRPALAVALRKMADFNFRTQKRIIKKYFRARAGEKVLDLGCGTGEFSPYFSAEQYIGIDIDESNVKYAQQRHARKFTVADGMNLPFADRAFNKVLIVGVFHHLSGEDCEKVIAEIKRVLTPGGEILVMEDTASSLPWTKIMHALDQGAYIRSSAEWQRLWQRHFNITKAFTFKNGVCFYSAFLLRN